MSDILIGNYSPEGITVILSKGSFSHQVTGFVEGSLSASRMVVASEPYIGSD